MRLLVRVGRPLRRAGFSLMEMLVVVAITSILATMAAPALISTLDSYRRATLSSRLMSDLALARSKALVLGKSVALCGSNGSNIPTCSVQTKEGVVTKTDWSKGWYMYVGSSATVGTVIRKPEAAPSGWVIDAHLSSPGSYIYLDPRSSTNKYGHFTIYRSGSTTAACVILSSTGRAKAFTASVDSGVVGPASAQNPCN